MRYAFTLTSDELDFLRQHAEDVIPVLENLKVTDTGCHFSADYDSLIFELTDAVIYNGMDDEDTVNDIGKRLYSITDNLVAQKHAQSE